MICNRLKIRACCLFLLFILGEQISFAAEPKLRFGINQNFTRLFDDPEKIKWSYAIPKHVLEQAGYDVKVVFRPSLRLPVSLERNDVNLIISTEPTMRQYSGNFIRSELPVGIVDFFIYYDLRRGWQPVWPPDATFKQKIGKSVQSALALKSLFNSNIKQAATFDAAVKMVNLGRLDYYIENSAGLSLISDGLLRSEQQGFKLEVLYTTPAFVYFRDTPVSRNILANFNRQLLTLFLQGEFSSVFYRHVDMAERQDSVKILVNYINANYKPLLIPAQKEVQPPQTDR